MSQFIHRFKGRLLTTVLLVPFLMFFGRPTLAAFQSIMLLGVGPGAVSGATNDGLPIFVQFPLTATTTDGASIFWGQRLATPLAVAGAERVYMLATGSITAAYVLCNAVTAGTAEAWPLYIRVNDTTDTLIQSQTLATNLRTWSNNALAIAITSGDFIEMKFINPTWPVTNPANLDCAGYFILTKP